MVRVKLELLAAVAGTDRNSEIKHGESETKFKPPAGGRIRRSEIKHGESETHFDETRTNLELNARIPAW